MSKIYLGQYPQTLARAGAFRLRRPEKPLWKRMGGRYGDIDMQIGRFTYHTILICLAVLVSGCEHIALQNRTVRPPEPMEHFSTEAVPSAAVSMDDPIHLLIPVIHVDAPIEKVGVLPNGELDTPQQEPYANVGWYSGGPRPGERGSSVIDGHLNRPGGAPAVFKYLRNLQVDDEVIVTMGSGKKLHFYVTTVAAYPPKNAPLQSIFGKQGGNYLNLITCAGYWIPSQQQTTLRMVVYTSLR